MFEVNWSITPKLNQTTVKDDKFEIMPGQWQPFTKYSVKVEISTPYREGSLASASLDIQMESVPFNGIVNVELVTNRTDMYTISIEYWEPGTASPKPNDVVFNVYSA